MGILQQLGLRIRQVFNALILRLEQWLLAHEARQSDPLVVAGAIRSPACRALEYDAYMRNNRSITGLPMECTVEPQSHRVTSER
jgi:hypothetical protein